MNVEQTSLDSLNSRTRGRIRRTIPDTNSARVFVARSGSHVKGVAVATHQYLEGRRVIQVMVEKGVSSATLAELQTNITNSLGYLHRKFIWN